MMPDTTPANNTGTATAGQTLLPPEEQFWKKYSPHAELPLSGISSFALHGLAVGLLFIGAWLVLRLGFDKKPLPVDAVVFSGGGGNPKGVGKGPGDGAVGEVAKEHPGEKPDPDKKTPSVDDPNLKAPNKPTLPPVAIDVSNNDHIRTLIERGSQTAKDVESLGKEANKLLRGLEQAGQGRGGTGSGGGQGTGQGTGTGSGAGDGKANLNVRQKRVLRWTMLFETLNGEDYRKQLQALGAILAIPDPQKPDQYLIVNELTAGKAVAKPGDLSEIKRIFWVDNRPESVRNLTAALGLKGTPPHVVAFFPEKLEQELLEKELAYARKKFRANITEDEIQETKFVVEKRSGSYEPRVQSVQESR